MPVLGAGRGLSNAQIRHPRPTLATKIDTPSPPPLRARPPQICWLDTDFLCGVAYQPDPATGRPIAVASRRTGILLLFLVIIGLHLIRMVHPTATLIARSARVGLRVGAFAISMKRSVKCAPPRLGTESAAPRTGQSRGWYGQQSEFNRKLVRNLKRHGTTRKGLDI